VLLSIKRLFVASVALVMLGTSAALGQSWLTDEEYARPNLLKQILPPEKARALCYVSGGAPVSYALEDIPARKTPRILAVRRFTFLLRSEKHDDDDTVKPPKPGRFYYAFGMVAEPVGRKRRLVAGGECGSLGMEGFGCGVECDGGTVSFEPIAGSDSILMRISSDVRRFRMTWGCSDGEGNSEVLTYDPSTPSVRFDKADPKACRLVEKILKESQ
jgi:hypothetical protein